MCGRHRHRRCRGRNPPMIARLPLSQLAFVVSAMLVGAAISPGCYKPSIQDGALGCGPNSSCPDGFHCMSGRCYLFKVDASVSDADGALKSDTLAEASPDTSGDAPDAGQVCVQRT